MIKYIDIRNIGVTKDLIKVILEAEGFVDKAEIEGEIIGDNSEYYEAIINKANEIINRSGNCEFVGWQPCIEEDYWKSDADIIAFKDSTEGSDEYFFYTQRDCPFGWNVLCKSEAYIFHMPNVKQNN